MYPPSHGCCVTRSNLVAQQTIDDHDGRQDKKDNLHRSAAMFPQEEISQPRHRQHIEVRPRSQARGILFGPLWQKRDTMICLYAHNTFTQNPTTTTSTIDTRYFRASSARQPESLIKNHLRDLLFASLLKASIIYRIYCFHHTTLDLIFFHKFYHAGNLASFDTSRILLKFRNTPAN